ncbi:MAG: energy transducer TonB [Rhodoferax sp.]|uniref:energy transducer TonB n=1 Tax=Rhodoferax sp. TaxID=50421 RepID=UPI002636B0C6|nr:energy transducer TonB [Rhodoferax sp.]MDD2880653.1 energy transducer TonB [Rhodoferax sp.]
MTPSLPTQSAPGKTETGLAQTGPAISALPPSLQLPSSAADYLNNPAPVYPAISQRLGEQGKVVLRVLITKDGSARQAEIQESSGFDRLDQAALRAVMGWRYVPGRRAGVPQDMWFNVPINFALK